MIETSDDPGPEGAAPRIPDNFTHQHYSETLARYREAGYKVISFKDFVEAEPNGPVMILRHDVDLDLEVAFRMAKLDHAAGCRSTWFVRLHARGYNPMTLQNLRIMEAMRRMGHEITLHLEPSIAFEIGEDPYEFADRQKAMFEAMTGEPIIGFSPHEPTRSSHPNLLDELVDRWGLKYHAYQPQFTNEMKYISDSSSRWREGCFSNWVGKAERLQVLVHPFWWYERVPQENY